jgi:hypothetical protein
MTDSSGFFPGDGDSNGGDCNSEFEPLVTRAGDLGLLSLAYECGASDCRGNEAFGENLRHDVRIDLPQSAIAKLTIESDDLDIARAEIKHTELDECAGESRSYVQIEANTPGTTTLRVLSGGVEIDSISIRVAATHSMTLRASPIYSFDFSEADDTVETTRGQALLVMPRLLDEDGHPLLGTPMLSWQSQNADIATVREAAVSDEEEMLRSTTAVSVVFVDAHATGKTVIVARTTEDVAATLEVRVLEANVLAD